MERFRLALDAGETSTGLVLQAIGGPTWVYKAASSPADRQTGVLAVLMKAAQARTSRVDDLLGRVDVVACGSTLADGTRPSLAALLAARGYAGEVRVVGAGDGTRPASARLSAVAGCEIAPGVGRPIVVCDAGGSTYDVIVTGAVAGMESVSVGGASAVTVADGSLRVGGTGGPGGGGRTTPTDAWVVLGYLGPGGLSSSARASRAVGHGVARPLGLDVLTAAEAVHRLTTRAMADRLRVVAAAHGLDGGCFVAAGGASGPTAVAVARLAGFASVYVPFVAPAQSAYGALVAVAGGIAGHVALGEDSRRTRRPVHFLGVGVVDTPVVTPADIGSGGRATGPVLVESALATVVVEPGFVCTADHAGLLVEREAGRSRHLDFVRR